MAANPASRPGTSGALTERVINTLRASGFTVAREVKFESCPFPFDIAAEREILGRLYRIVVECKEGAQPLPIEEISQRTGFLAVTHLPTVNHIDECWYVARNVPARTKEAFEKERRLRILSFKEFRELVVDHKEPKAPAKTRQSEAVVMNHQQIAISSKALIILLDDKIAALQSERPNSQEAIAARENSILAYRAIRGDLAALQAAATTFGSRPGAKEQQQVLKSAKRFADGVGDWWNKHHDSICSKAFDMGMFLSAVSICSLAGSGGKVAAIIGAALVGGKSVGGVLKGLAKKLPWG
jgi:hypothetical protein